MDWKTASQEAGVTMDTNRHTAIQCSHQTDAIRARIRKALEESSLMPFLSLRYSSELDLNDVLDFATTVVAAECVSIMWEHSGETAAEYRQILKQERGTR